MISNQKLIQKNRNIVWIKNGNNFIHKNFIQLKSKELDIDKNIDTSNINDFSQLNKILK